MRTAPSRTPAAAVPPSPGLPASVEAEVVEVLARLLEGAYRRRDTGGGPARRGSATTSSPGRWAAPAKGPA
jgi:hypothetical protein